MKCVKSGNYIFNVFKLRTVIPVGILFVIVDLQIVTVTLNLDI